MGRNFEIPDRFRLRFGLVWFRGLTPQQQPGSYQGGEMMMKSVFWWRKPEHPEETTDLRQVTDETEVNIANTAAIMDMIRAPLSRQTCCTSTGNCSINIESINSKLSRHKAKNIIQAQDKVYYEIPHSS